MSEHVEVAAYAMGLMDEADSARFEQHLAGCDECADQLDWMAAVVDDLAEVEPDDLFGLAGPGALEGADPGRAGGAGRRLHSIPAAPPMQSIRPAAAQSGPIQLGRDAERPATDRRPQPSEPYPAPYPAADGPFTGDIPIGGPRGRRRMPPAGDETPRRSRFDFGGRRLTGPSAERGRGLAVAAAAAVVGVLVGAGAVTLGGGPGEDRTGITIAGSSDRIAATDARTGVHADVGMDEKAWGTLVSFGVSDIDGPRECQLVAVRKDGTSEVLSTWVVPDGGYDGDSEPRELQLMAATALHRRDIEALEVQDVGRAGATTLVRLTV